MAFNEKLQGMSESKKKKKKRKPKVWREKETSEPDSDVGIIKTII